MQKISTRLAVSFLIVALLPAVPLSLVVRDLLERRFGPAITQPLEDALEAGLEVSRAHLQDRRDQLVVQAGALESADTFVLLDGQGRPMPADSLRVRFEADPGLESWAGSVEPGADPVRRGGLLGVRTAGNPGSVVMQPLPPDLVDRAGRITNGISLFRAVGKEKGRVILSFVAPFLVIYGVLIVVALVLGHLWTRSMVRPLESLVAGTRRVGSGDLEFRITPQGPGEVGELERSFDTMIRQLADQRRDLARLEQVAAWRGMARTLAHEVKNPLTPIMLAVQESCDGYKGDDEKYRALLVECTEIVREEVETLRALVKEFSDFARLPKPIPKPGDLTDLGRDLGHLYGDHLDVGLETEQMEGWLDNAAMRRALINLIDNGLAACREAGRPEQVRLEMKKGDPGAVVTVTDQGAGIAPKNLEKIFQPDFTTKSGGMGLGLAIVMSIVAGHGGSIEVDSEQGKGTRFTMTLPLTPVADTETESEGDTT